MKTARSVALAAVAVVVGGIACGPSVLVDDCYWLGEGPLPLNVMPNLDMLIGDTVETSLVEYFGHMCRDYELSHTARSADPAVAVPISGTVLTTVAVGVADSVRVDVTATDQVGDSAVQDFYVWVRPR